MIEHYMKNNNYESMSISQKEFEIIRLHKENLKIIKRNRALLVKKATTKNNFRLIENIYFKLATI